jgi:hypothetical protein
MNGVKLYRCRILWSGQLLSGLRYLRTNFLIVHSSYHVWSNSQPKNTLSCRLSRIQLDRLLSASCRPLSRE